MSDEGNEHRKLRETTRAIFEKSGFRTYSRVQLDMDKDGKPDRELDVCAVDKKLMLIVECKSGKNLDDVNKELSSWQHDIENMLEDPDHIHVISSSKGLFNRGILKRIKEIKLGFAFTDRLQNNQLERILRKKSIVFWDDKAVKYFDKTSSRLREWVKYEIFREFGVSQETKDIHPERAVLIEQGSNEMFLLGMHPGLLLKIGYVLRRTSGKPDAYQRVINKDRIEHIGKFISDVRNILPNAVIIAFDDDKQVQDEIKYKNGILRFPVKYCSAWIIDGQHRVYGFIKTKYKKWNDEVNDEYKLPVVAFRKLEERSQTTTFVNINYYQKKIDATLLCDLATVIQDLKNELTWPSLLVSKLNRVEPWKDLIKISEFDPRRSIKLASFAQFALLISLLGYNKRKGKYSGPLYRYAPFEKSRDFHNAINQAAFKKQFELLKRYFSMVREKFGNENKDEDAWLNFRKYGLTKATGVNALMLVLSRILEKYPQLTIDLKTYLDPIKKVDFTNEHVVMAGGGWKGFRNLANEIIEKLNEHNNDNLQFFEQKSKT